MSILISIYKGVVAVANLPENQQLEVLDYDTDGVPPERLHVDCGGRKFSKRVWKGGTELERTT